jgi:hypothetical protein
MIHTLVHASWLNQIEIFSSIIQKKSSPRMTSPAWNGYPEPCSPSLDRSHRTAKPFNWKLTTADLTDLLHRIREHEQAGATRQTDLATAA